MSRPRIPVAVDTPFGHWTVIAQADNDARGNHRVRVRCVCGAERDMVVSELRRGGSKSCGCMKGVHVSRGRRGLDPTASTPTAEDVGLAGFVVDGQALSANDLMRFRATIRSAGPNDCWTWSAARTQAGYGRLHCGGRQGGHLLTHRVALSLSLRASVPADRQVCHRCDNPPCCNPAHLFVGTAADNVHDAVAKGRIAHGDRHGTATKPERRAVGERHGGAKLTEEDVRTIRARAANGDGHDALATCFGVARATVTDVVSRRKWRHVS